MICVLLRHRTGNWWHRAKAHRYRTGYRGGQVPPADDLCPLCRAHTDSSSHTLLECPRLKAMHTKRHDTAVRKVLKALQRHSRHADAYTILDACRAEQLGELGAAAKRLPWWLLPEAAASDDALAKMRPDILRNIGLPAASDAQRLLEDLSVMAAQAAHDITVARRRQEDGGRHKTGVG